MWLFGADLGMILAYRLEVSMDNYIIFGRRLEHIREGLSLSKLDVYKLTGISTETIRRIEYGKVIPKFETLDLLSEVYKKDIVKLFIDYRLKDYSYFNELINRIELKFDNHGMSSLYEEAEELKSFVTNIDNSFYKVTIEQMIVLIESIILYRNEKRYEKSLNTLIDGIRLTTPEFSLEKYKDFVYNSLEIRLLMNIAFLVNKLGEKQMYTELLEFCVGITEPNESMYPKLCYNLASAYRRNKDYEKSLKYSSLSIQFAQKQRNYGSLNILFYGKGLSEFHLDMEEYRDSFKMCFSLCDAFGQLELKENLIKTFKKIHGVDPKE